MNATKLLNQYFNPFCRDLFSAQKPLEIDQASYGWRSWSHLLDRAANVQNRALRTLAEFFSALLDATIGCGLIGSLCYNVGALTYNHTYVSWKNYSSRKESEKALKQLSQAQENSYLPCNKTALKTYGLLAGCLIAAGLLYHFGAIHTVKKAFFQRPLPLTGNFSALIAHSLTPPPASNGAFKIEFPWKIAPLVGVLAIAISCCPPLHSPLARAGEPRKLPPPSKERRFLPATSPLPTKDQIKKCTSPEEVCALLPDACNPRLGGFDCFRFEMPYNSDGKPSKRAQEVFDLATQGGLVVDYSTSPAIGTYHLHSLAPHLDPKQAPQGSPTS